MKSVIYYNKPIQVNLPIKFRKKLLYNVFNQVWPWALTLIMFFWISSFRIEMFLNLIIHSNKNIERKYKYEMSTM